MQRIQRDQEIWYLLFPQVESHSLRDRMDEGVLGAMQDLQERKISRRMKANIESFLLSDRYDLD